MRLFYIALLLVCCLLFTTCSRPLILEHYQENGKYGFRDQHGNTIIEAQYDNLGWDFYNGFENVMLQKKWGVINRKGDLVIPIIYDYIGDFNTEGYAEAKLNGSFGMIDSSGRTIIEFKYQALNYFDKQCIRAKLNSKCGIININDSVIIPFEYDNMNYHSWNEGVMEVEVKKKWGFIDTTNKLILAPQYDGASAFYNGLALVSTGYNQWGFINKKNEVVVPFIYDWPIGIPNANFSTGMALMIKNEKFGYIDSTGKTIIEFKYSRLGPFIDGLAYAETDNGAGKYSNDNKTLFSGYVDINGKEYLRPFVDYTHFKWNISPAPDAIPDYSYLMQNWPNAPTAAWTLESLVAQGASAFRNEPITYADRDNIREVSAAYGLMLGGGNYGEDFMYAGAEGFPTFKEKTLYAIIGKESLRKITWAWIRPYYKESFQSLDTVHQNIYREMAEYLRDYMDHYDKQKTLEFLRRDPDGFARYDREGNYDPYRKLSAFVDRLILVHRVVSVKEARKWVNIMADDLESW